MSANDAMTAQGLGKLDELVRRFADGGRPGALLGILEEAQELQKGNYLSEDALRRIAELTGTPLSRLYSIATFYSYFNLSPQGEHTVVVCRGTACHTRGSRSLLADAAARLHASGFDIDEDSTFTTEDALITVRTVACFGQCALAPVVSVDGLMYSRMNSTKLASLIAGLLKAKSAREGRK
jgi:NADH-quinone oxidoreductase subunit E